MKSFAIAAAALVISTGAALADPVLGTWKTEPNDGYYVVKMQQCGATMCGVIQDRVDAQGKSTGVNKGKKLVLELANNGGGDYSGKVWHPGKDKIFKGKAKLNGNRMAMSGCVLGGLICQDQTWTRAK